MKKKMFMTIVVLFLLVIISVCTISTMKVKAADKIGSNKEEYHIQEMKFLEKLDDVLEENQYFNSGVTMTKVMSAAGEREYQVVIHHKMIDKLSEIQREALHASLLALGTPGENCQISYEFLILDAQ